MEIPNLNSTTQIPVSNQAIPVKNSSPISPLKIVLVLVVALGLGFWLSRLLPFSSSSGTITLPGQQQAISTENIQDKSQIETGKLYGDTEKSFKDSAIGTVEKGSINGEGTHILNRDGGASQRVSLTSSVVDLDLFIGRKVEVKGETNASNKTAWLLDVGSVKVLE